MYAMLPEAKEYKKGSGKTKEFNRIGIVVKNERNFDIIKNNYFDVNPVSEAGTKSCMIPYHELKRVLTNEFYPDKRDDEPIYLGVEALGLLWL